MKNIKFVIWCKEQVKRNDAVGDIARDIVADEEFPATGLIAVMVGHIKKYPNHSDKAIDALKKAWAEYRETKAK